MNRTVLLVTGTLLAVLFLFAEYTWRQQVLADADTGVHTPVLATARRIEGGTVLTRDMVQIVREGERIIRRSPDVITPTKLDGFIDRPVRRTLAPGELLRESDFASSTERRLAGEIPGQRRGVAVQVDPLNGFGGLLRPGDHIDILATLMHYDKKQLVTRPLLDRVEVLAVGDVLIGEEGTPSQRTRTTVTLDVKPADALRLKHIEKTGELVFLLRNPKDEAPMAYVDEIDSRGLVTPVPDRAPRTAPHKSWTVH